METHNVFLWPWGFIQNSNSARTCWILLGMKRCRTFYHIIGMNKEFSGYTKIRWNSLFLCFVQFYSRSEQSGETKNEWIEGVRLDFWIVSVWNPQFIWVFYPILNSLEWHRTKEILLWNERAYIHSSKNKAMLYRNRYTLVLYESSAQKAFIRTHTSIRINAHQQTK